MTAGGELQRRLGVSDAVVIGAGSMIGAGVFAAWSPAAEAAGTGLVVGLVIAGLVALCNASSSAQLAAIHPRSGGTYEFGRQQLGDGWGHLAGWGFVVGKTASCSAMALTVGAYLWPERERLAAVAAVVAITVVNIGGLTRTVAVTKLLLVVSVSALALVVVGGWSSSEASIDRITPVTGGPFDVLQSAGLLFFAFAGYARIATLGEEVREPARTIPRAIPLALGAVLVVYGIVAVTALATVDATDLAMVDAPLKLVIETGPLDVVAPLVAIGAGVASLGVLLNLIPGVSRTVFAMARNHELPGWYAHVDARRSIPLRAELTQSVIVVALVAFLDIRDSIGLSGVAVLTYYAITNASALTLTAEQRRWPRAFAVIGLVGCIVLIVTLPPTAVVVGCGVLALGVAARAVTVRRAR